MSFIPPHSAAPSPYGVYKEHFQQKGEYIFYTYTSAHFQRFMLRRPPSHSDLGLKCIDKGAASHRKETSCWEQRPVHVHMDKCTEKYMETKTVCFRNPTPKPGSGCRGWGCVWWKTQFCQARRGPAGFLSGRAQQQRDQPLKRGPCGRRPHSRFPAVSLRFPLAC